VLTVTLSGHWEVSSNWCYASVLVDGTSLANNNCNSAVTDCYGAAHTYGTTWAPVGFTAYTLVAAGQHTLSAAVVPAGTGTTCYMNGARIFWQAIPR
jgi:hypothetical protein